MTNCVSAQIQGFLAVVQLCTRNGRACAVYTDVYILVYGKLLGGDGDVAVFQVAFGLLLAFYNRENPIQSVDVPLL